MGFRILNICLILKFFSRALCWVYTTYFWRVTYNNMFLIFHFFKAKINFVFCWQMIMMVWKGADIYFSIHKCKANNFLKCQREGNNWYKTSNVPVIFETFLKQHVCFLTRFTKQNFRQQHLNFDKSIYTLYNTWY